MDRAEPDRAVPAKASVPRLALVLFLVLAACTQRPQLIPAQVPDGVSRIHRIFVGTTRRYQEPGRFGAMRSAGMAFARLDVSVPTGRAPGSLTWPRRDPADPARDFLLAGATFFSGAASFRADLARALSARGPRSREAVIYVHGFNNSFDEGVLRIAQLAEDFRLPGVAVHYSWPSAAQPLTYAYDRDSALYARDGLVRLIDEVRAAGARRVILVGHSLGGMVITEALRQMSVARPGSAANRIDGVILISPDMDVELFRAQALRIGQLPQPFAIVVSRKDRVLRLSALLTGQTDRLGNLKSTDRVEDLEVTIVDVTAFTNDTIGHFTAGNSPALIRLIGSLHTLDETFRDEGQGNTGPALGTVLLLRKAREVVVGPVLAQ